MPLPSWSIITSKPASEELVERGLRQAGYRVYMPRYRKLLRPHGQHRRPATIMKPLFGRIVFVHDWRGWPQVPVTGSAGLMFVRPKVPAKLPDDDVLLILHRERAGEFDEVQQALGAGLVVRSDIEPGEEVQFDAFGRRVMGVLEELTDQGRAIVSALIFGGEVRTTVDAALIEKVAAV